MEEIVERSGVAKTTIYRHFPTKDLLIGAFLDQEDREFWEQWEAVVADRADAGDCLAALCDWIGQRVVREGYRGCPQLNMAAEFSDPAHPARIVARRHKAEMNRRLLAICEAGKVPDAPVAAMQIALLFDGAFASDGRLADYRADVLLRGGVAKLIAG